MLTNQQLSQLQSVLTRTNWIAIALVLLVSLDYWLALSVGSSTSEIHPDNILLPGKLAAWYLLACHALVVTDLGALCWLVAATILPSAIYFTVFFEQIVHGYESLFMALSTFILATGSYIYGRYRRMDVALELTVFACLVTVIVLYSPLINIGSYLIPVVSVMLKNYNVHGLQTSIVYSFSGSLLCVGCLFPMLVLWLGLSASLSKSKQTQDLFEQQWFNFKMSITAHRLASTLIVLKCLHTLTGLTLPDSYLIPQWCIYELATFVAATQGLSLCHYAIAILNNGSFMLHSYAKAMVYKAFVGILFISFLLLRDIFVCIGLLDKLVDTRTRYNMKLSLQH